MDKWWQVDFQNVAKALNTDYENGLSKYSVSSKIGDRMCI